MTNNFLCFPGWKTKALTFSYDDGNIKDRDLVELFDKYGVKGTFNLNSEKFFENGCEYNISKNEVKDLYKNHEVAVHTVSHPRLELLPSSQITREVAVDKENLEKLSGTIVRGMAYPFGTYSDEVVDVLEKCGIKYSRTVESHHSFKLPTDWLRMGATCHHSDDKIMELIDKFVSSDPTKEHFKYDGWLFYIWGHSYEFRTEEDWLRMDAIVSRLAKRKDTWYATNIEIYDYITAYRALEFSNDRTIVYNPSGIDVYFLKEGKQVVVKAGETIKL